MWNVVPPAGIATATVDFTNDLSLLLIGLIGMVCISAGLLAWEVIRHHTAQPRRPAAEMLAAPSEPRKAA